MTDVKRLGISMVNAFDPRTVVKEPQYVLFRGPNSIAREQYPALANSNNQLQFNINLSPSMFYDRHFVITGDLLVQFQVKNGFLVQSGAPAVCWGRDVATCAFPFHECITSATCTVNGAQTDINMSLLKNIMLRLTSSGVNKKIRTCPSALDTTVSYNDSYGARSSPISGYNDADPMSGSIGNGCYANWEFCAADGTTVLADGQGYTINGGTAINIQNTGAGVQSGAVVSLLYSQASGSLNYSWAPVAGAPGNGVIYLPTGTAATVYMKLHFREACILPMTIFDDAREFLCEGFNNMQNILITYQIGGPSRMLRNCNAAGICIVDNSVQWSQVGNSILSPTIEMIKLEPPLGVKSYNLPARSLIPSCRFVTLNSPTFANLNSYADTGINGLITSSVSIDGIPDFMIIYAKPQQYLNQVGVTGNSVIGLAANASQYTEADWYLAIQNLQINFQGGTSLMNTFKAEDLFEISARNGLEMDYNTFYGQAMRLRTTSTSNNQIVQGSTNVPLVSGPIVLRPAYDFGTGGAPLVPGLAGSYTLQVMAKAYNQAAFTAQSPTLYVVLVYGGYLITNGPNNSEFTKSVVTVNDVFETDGRANPHSMDELSRFVGSGTFERMNNTYARPHHIHHSQHPRSHSEPPASGGMDSGGDSGGRRRRLG